LPTTDDRIRDLLIEGRSLLGQGRGGDAADLFGRVLLLDANHVEARDGLAEARALSDEMRRRLDARLDQARAALDAGDVPTARALAEGVLQDGGDPDDAHHLIDRIESREAHPVAGMGVPEASPPSRSASPGRALAPRASGVAQYARYAFAGGSMLAFLVVAGSVAVNWSRLLGWLERSPEPLSRAVKAQGPSTATSGERAVADARRLLEQGDAAGALAALDRVSPQEPAYPFARQLRHQAESALLAGGRRR
jgi:hypothetical protein